MKKKIAVCGNGWSNEYLKIVMSGIRKCAAENNVDIFLLLNYSVAEVEAYKNVGEANIFRLLDYAKFDGAIILGNALHLEEEYSYLADKVKELNIPTVCLEYELPGCDTIASDNYSGMYDLCAHLVEHHGVKDVLYMSGPIDNIESETRRKALEDVLTKNNLSLDKNNIIYGNWNYNEVQRELPIWLKNHTKLPDAIVCANDVMAMATCIVLDQHGYEVPKDVIVTGFDHLNSAKNHKPKIASVDRNWTNMGYQGLKYVLEKIDNESTTISRQINSIAVPNESCRCFSDVIDKELIERENQNLYGAFVNGAFWGGHLCDVAECLSGVISADDFHEAFNEFLEREHRYEGNEIYMCLVENFFSSLFNGKKLKEKGYTSKMEVICGLKNALPYKHVKIDTKNLIPEYDEDSEASRLYVFVPIYSSDGCYGYIAFGDEVEMMYDYSLYNWMRNLKQNFERVRQNILMLEMNKQLSALSVTDGLTGVYNRMGCEKVAYPYLEECHRKGKRAVLMFADINKMKKINDKYGHLQGDIAICTVAKVIKDVLQEDWIIVRYGGDEFLMVGECIDNEHTQNLLNQISIHLKNTAKELHLPYNLTAGVGCVYIEPNEHLDLSDCLKRADEAMYAMKKELHKKSTV